MPSRGTRIGLGIWTVLVVAVPLDPARDHRALRVQRVADPELADLELVHPLVQRRVERRVPALVALALGRDRRSRRRRSRSFSGRWRRSRSTASVLRTRLVLVPASAADRAARDHHRHGAQLVLLVRGRDVLVLDDRRRTRDVLRGGRLQQRDRAPAADVAVAHRGVDGSRCRRVADVPLRHLADSCRRRSSPAGCWPSRSPSTR